MRKTLYSVAVVVDRDFGDRVSHLAWRQRTWIVQSPVNLAATHRFDPSGHIGRVADPLRSGITLFEAAEGDSAEEVCIIGVELLDDHHSPYTEGGGWLAIEVYGVALSRRLQDVFEEIGGAIFLQTVDGFVCRR